MRIQGDCEHGTDRLPGGWLVERCYLMTQMGLREVRKEGCLEVAEWPGIRQDSGTKNNHGVSIGFIRLSRGSRTACPGKKFKDYIKCMWTPNLQSFS